jgi:single-stranded DNA-binding protein
MNTCALVGYLERDPVVRFKQETGEQTVSFTVRTEEPGKQGSFKTYIPIETFGAVATKAESLCKGQLVAIEGRIGWKAYEHRGEKRTTLIVLARSVQVLAEAEALAPPPPAQSQRPPGW